MALALKVRLFENWREIHQKKYQYQNGSDCTSVVDEVTLNDSLKSVID